MHSVLTCFLAGLAAVAAAFACYSHKIAREALEDLEEMRRELSEAQRLAYEMKNSRPVEFRVLTRGWFIRLVAVKAFRGENHEMLIRAYAPDGDNLRAAEELCDKLNEN